MSVKTVTGFGEKLLPDERFMEPDAKALRPGTYRTDYGKDLGGPVMPSTRRSFDADAQNFTYPDFYFVPATFLDANSNEKTAPDFKVAYKVIKVNGEQPSIYKGDQIAAEDPSKGADLPFEVVWGTGKTATNAQGDEMLEVASGQTWGWMNASALKEFNPATIGSAPKQESTGHFEGYEDFGTQYMCPDVACPRATREFADVFSTPPEDDSPFPEPAKAQKFTATDGEQWLGATYPAMANLIGGKSDAKTSLMLWVRESDLNGAQYVAGQITTSKSSKENTAAKNSKDDGMGVLPWAIGLAALASIAGFIFLKRKSGDNDESDSRETPASGV